MIRTIYPIHAQIPSYIPRRTTHGGPLSAGPVCAARCRVGATLRRIATHRSGEENPDLLSAQAAILGVSIEGSSMTTKRGRWVLVAIACAIAVIVCLVGPRHGPHVLGWVVYGNWEPYPRIYSVRMPDGSFALAWRGPDGSRKKFQGTYCKTRRKRLSWFPGEESETIRITKEEYERLSERAGQ